MLPLESSWSSQIADTLPSQIVEFRGVAQGQGDWEYCRRYNTRLIPSLMPYYNHTNLESADWKSLRILQQYTDGEAFFLCHPAAFRLGYLENNGEEEKRVPVNWEVMYLNRQNGTTSQTYAATLMGHYKQVEYHVASPDELVSIITSAPSTSICLLQIACAFAPFENRPYGHYVSIHITHSNSDVVISGILAPFGIYDTPQATVSLNELAQFAITTTRIMQKQARLDKGTMQDGADSNATEVIVVDTKPTN